MSTSTGPGPVPTPALLLCLVAAPLVAVAARLVGTPWLEEPAEYLADVGAHAARSRAGGLLTMLSAVLFIPAGLALAAAIRPHAPKLAAAGAAMTAVGAVALAGVGTVSLVAAQIARQPERATMVRFWDEFYRDPNGNIVFLALIIGGAGYVVLAVGLYRSRVAPLPAAALVGLGGAGTMLTAPGPVRALLVGTALLALTGFSWVAAAVRPRDSRHSTHRPDLTPSPGRATNC
jgi:hypothetical protein